MLDIDGLSKEENRLYEIRKQKESKINRLKSYLVNIMQVLEKNKIET